MLQSAILRGLGRAEAVACVSRYTLRDFQRLLPAFRGRIDVVPNALNYPYRELETSRQATKTPYVLHVGSSHRRKNRETAIRAMAAIAARWEGNLVFAGQALSAEQRRLAASLGAADRIVEVINPDNPALERLYNGALALIFPSRFEGFGWPVIEAQACGCAVICSDREPFPEVSGGAAVFCDADDAAAFGDAILSLANSSALRRDLSDRGLSNAAHHSLSAMTAGIEALLEHALASR
jgi:glycosyltransferase involved in cell wall biosynthesis